MTSSMVKDVEAREKSMRDILTRVDFRLAEESDESFIYHSWLRTYRSSSPFTDGVSNTVFFTNHSKIIDGLMKQSNVVIICNREDVSQIIGYCCYSQMGSIPVMHFMYVKSAFRRLGIATTLLNEIKRAECELNWSTIIATHATKDFGHFKEKWHLVYNPYLAFQVVFMKG